MITAYKQFILSGDVSGYSDEDGVATFTDLTVIGAGAEQAYFLISVDGVVTVWTLTFNPVNP
jgi:hypothetical protein